MSGRLISSQNRTSHTPSCTGLSTWLWPNGIPLSWRIQFSPCRWESSCTRSSGRGSSGAARALWQSRSWGPPPAETILGILHYDDRCDEELEVTSMSGRDRGRPEGGEQGHGLARAGGAAQHLCKARCYCRCWGMSCSYHGFMLGEPGVEEGLVPDGVEGGHHDVRGGNLHESGRGRGASWSVNRGKWSRFAGGFQWWLFSVPVNRSLILKSCRWWSGPRLTLCVSTSTWGTLADQGTQSPDIVTWTSSQVRQVMGGSWGIRACSFYIPGKRGLGWFVQEGRNRDDT